jgi:AcrR family transcriptional regulator
VSAVPSPIHRSTRKARGHGHLRRAEILAAAEAIFVAEGYERATIRRIAEEVGVSSTALYMHFPDKAAILQEICEGVIAQLLERNREVAARPLAPRRRVRMMLESYMRWGFQHPNAYRLVFSGGPALSSVWLDSSADLGARCFEIFQDSVAEIAATDGLRAGDVDSVAQALWAACHGVVTLRIARPIFDWAPVDELIALTVDGLIRGLFVEAPTRQ